MFTPLAAYSRCSVRMTGIAATEPGSRLAMASADSGSADANSRASAMRQASANARASAASAAASRSGGFESPVIACASSSVTTRTCVIPFPNPAPDPQAAAPLTQIGAKARSCCTSSTPSRTISSIAEMTTPAPCAHGGLDDVARQIIVQRGPVHSDADQTLQRLARLRQGPHHPAMQAHAGERMFLPLPRVGGEQVVERGVPLGRLRDHDGLGLAAGEHVTAEARAVYEPRRGPDRLEPLQPIGELAGEVLRGGFVPLGGIGQKQRT